MTQTRREFLAGAAALSAAPASAQPAAGGWYDRPMRWAQVAFTEDDPGNFDLRFWLEYFQRIHADRKKLRRHSMRCRCRISITEGTGIGDD